MRPQSPSQPPPRTPVQALAQRRRDGLRTAKAFLALLLTVGVLTNGPAADAARKRAAKAPPAPAFDAPEDLLRFIDGYRAKPQPDRLPDFVKAMARLAMVKEIESAGVYLGFAAGVLSANPANATKLVARMFPLPPPDQVIVVKALAYSGLPDWQDRLRAVTERMPARRVLIDRYLSGKMQPLQALPIETGPAAVDANWGFYFATGSRAAMRRIAAALLWANEQNDVEKLTVAAMAKWTLAKNAARDTDLLAMLKEDASLQPKPIAAELRAIIEAVETYETAKLRTDAIARIETLKQKGPAKNRNMAWWAQAGTTAIALGCVAAAALGQVQFGLPCVIGGPASTAAAKYLLPQ